LDISAPNAICAGAGLQPLRRVYLLPRPARQRDWQQVGRRGTAAKRRPTVEKWDHFSQSAEIE
jgi:hypothetical protein